MKIRALILALASLFAGQALAAATSDIATQRKPALKKSAEPKRADKPSGKTAVARKSAPAKGAVVKPAPRAQARAPVKAAVARDARRKPVPVVKAAPQPAVEEALDMHGGPRLASAAFFVTDLRSGEVLLERNAGTVLPIASITKLMTAMVVLESGLPLSEELTIGDADVDTLKGSSSRIPVGTTLSREEMLHLALMSSENRAASALGHNYPGGIRAFVSAMNAKARLLGLHDTHFEDSTGLNPNNVSSPRDLARMVSAAANYPLIRSFSTQAERQVVINGRTLQYRNTNALVKDPEWEIGLSKTGFIREAGRCLVMQAWMLNRPMAIVLMDSNGRNTRTADAERIKKWLEANGGHKVAAARREGDS